MISSEARRARKHALRALGGGLLSILSILSVPAFASSLVLKRLDLGPGPRPQYAEAINDEGAIAAVKGPRLVVALDGQKVPIRLPDGFYPSVASALNDKGQVVGYALDFHGGGEIGFLWEPGRSEVLQPAGCENTAFTGINNGGAITVFAHCSGLGQGFTLAQGVFTPLNVPGALLTYPSGINDRGEVVGYATDCCSSVGFVYSGGSFTKIVLPGEFTELTAISSGDQLLGYSYHSGSRKRQYYVVKNGVTTPLLVPGSREGRTIATAQSRNGRVTGYFTDTTGAVRGFYYHDGHYSTTDAVPGFKVELLGVNDRGEMAGQLLSTDFLERLSGRLVLLAVTARCAGDGC
jgi:uncharacterized membrane protein